MEPVWRWKEKECTLYLGAGDRALVWSCYHSLAMSCCLRPLLCFVFHRIRLTSGHSSPWLFSSPVPAHLLQGCSPRGVLLWGSLQLGLLTHSSSRAAGDSHYPADPASDSRFIELEAYVHRTVSCWGPLQNSCRCPLSYCSALCTGSS